MAKEDEKKKRGSHFGKKRQERQQNRENVLKRKKKPAAVNNLQIRQLLSNFIHFPFFFKVPGFQRAMAVAFLAALAAVRP